MRIIVDGFGGDNAPLEVIKGCRMAVDSQDVEITITGRESEIVKVAQENDISLHRIAIEDCPDVISVEDDPTDILKKFSESSMARGIKMVADGQGDAFITAGSTGAFVVGSTFIARRMKGVKRPALATIVPGNDAPFFLVDIGAHAECRPNMHPQFALMGYTYMKNVAGIENPTVALVNIGVEETKGGVLQQEAYEILKRLPINFCGNVEPRDVPYGKYNVVVCDGFTGNVIVKLTEGVVSAFMSNLKNIFMSSPLTKIASLTVKKGLRAFKQKMDYSEHGGAPLMGIQKPVFKAHGSSDAKAFMNTVRQAKLYVESDVNAKLEAALAQMSTHGE